MEVDPPTITTSTTETPSEQQLQKELQETKQKKQLTANNNYKVLFFKDKINVSWPCAGKNSNNQQ